MPSATQGAVIAVKVLDANKGGLITRVEGVPAFVPVSQLSPEHYPRVAGGEKARIQEKLKQLVEQQGVDPAEAEPQAADAGREALIKTVADLKGKTVAFAASGGLDSCTVTKWLTEHGVSYVALTRASELDYLGKAEADLLELRPVPLAPDATPPSRLVSDGRAE